MPADKLSKFWLLATFLLILIILVGGVVIWTRLDHGQPLSILEPTASHQFEGSIYIEGAIVKPGVYPLMSGDSIDRIIQASGGITENADLSNLQLYVPSAEANPESQKVDINRADSWLLQALPGIGEVKAQAILDYRRQNGPFRSIEELTQVTGITSSTFEKIKALVTIGEKEQESH